MRCQYRMKTVLYLCKVACCSGVRQEKNKNLKFYQDKQAGCQMSRGSSLGHDLTAKGRMSSDISPNKEIKTKSKEK